MEKKSIDSDSERVQKRFVKLALKFEKNRDNSAHYKRLVQYIAKFEEKDFDTVATRVMNIKYYMPHAWCLIFVHIVMKLNFNKRRDRKAFLSMLYLFGLLFEETNFMFTFIASNLLEVVWGKYLEYPENAEEFEEIKKRAFFLVTLLRESKHTRNRVAESYKYKSFREHGLLDVQRSDLWLDEGLQRAVCPGCGEIEKEKLEFRKCTACKLVCYCSHDCQKKDWGRHKEICQNRIKRGTFEFL